MRKIFVDLEMQPIHDKSKRRICRSEVIEIGAVMLDDSGKETDSFKQYVKPVYSDRLSNKISDLTGITDGKLSGARHFEEVAEEFASWCLQYGQDIEIYAWSESDLTQIQSEINLKQIQPSSKLSYLFEHWNDFQQEYGELIGAVDPQGLDHALSISGISFSGKMHDALCDARNTASLYKVTRNRDEYLMVLSQIKDETDTAISGICIADLINLDVLKQAIA